MRGVTMDLQRQYEDDFAMTQQFAIITFMNRVYAWMSLGLAVTAVTAWIFGMVMPPEVVADNPMIYLVCFGFLIGFAFLVAPRIAELPAPIAIGAFMLYSLVWGVALSSVFLVHPLATISKTFFVTAGMFTGMAIYGTVTKKDLTSVGSLCLMGAWGLLLLIFVECGAFFLFGLSFKAFDIPIGILGVIIFIGLTAYDAQKVKQMSVVGETSTGLAVAGALALYIDFIIGIFIYLRHCCLKFQKTRNKRKTFPYWGYSGSLKPSKTTLKRSKPCVRKHARHSKSETGQNITRRWSTDTT